MLTIEKKKKIEEMLLAHCRRYPSCNQAAAALNNISPATVSNMLSGKNELISDEMYMNVFQQLAVCSEEWNVQETCAFKELYGVFKDAQKYKNVTWAVGDAGCGKSTTAACYRRDNKNTFVILCSEDMRKTDFVRAMAKQIGIPTEGLTLQSIFDMTIQKVSRLPDPLLIFDEGDKLTDTVFHYFITVYNRLENRTGIVFLSTPYIETRMANGLRYNKKGYREIMSRIGRRFFKLEATTANEVYAICKANGLDNEQSINKVIADAETCDFDLRRVNRLIHRETRMREKKSFK